MINISRITTIILGLVFLALAFCLFVYVFYEDYRKLEFCNTHYLGDTGHSYASHEITEQGYVECCRYIYVNHKRVQQCAILYKGD